MPRQTINHVTIPRMRRGILRKQASLAPGQKAFALTERGQSYKGPFLASMNAISRAVLADAPGKWRN